MTETPEQRSRIMRAVRSCDTGPELAVRHLLCELGYRGYRTHRKDLPGSPDIAFGRRRKAIFVHGCFWHAHSCHRGSRIPQTNQRYWLSKIARNCARDKANIAKLASLGWAVFTVWECEVSSDKMPTRLVEFMTGRPDQR